MGSLLVSSLPMLIMRSTESVLSANTLFMYLEREEEKIRKKGEDKKGKGVIRRERQRLKDKD